MQNITEIAKELLSFEEKLILIYAFNSTGKTRLSVEFKDLSKVNGENIGVYYNAYSEDLFVWDNDEENNNESIQLQLISSRLNNFHSLMTEENINEKLQLYKPKYNFRFNYYDDYETGLKSISFYSNNDFQQSIKISRGEERIFVWCFFLALFEIEAFSKKTAYFFIDDPVSSLDDHNIYITAYIVFELIQKEFENRKIIITSHHFGFLTILSELLSKGDKADKFRKGKEKKYKELILEGKNDNLSLIEAKNGVFLYHLRLLQILNNAIIKNEVYIYHFSILRQVLENIASFLGVGRFSFVLNEIGYNDENKISYIVNALSHLNVYYPKSDMLVPDNQDLLIEIFNKIQKKYNFKLPKVK